MTSWLLILALTVSAQTVDLDRHGGSAVALTNTPTYNAGTYTFDADMRRAWANRSRGKEALACGQVLITQKDGRRHAKNWYMDADLVFRLLEPQSWVESKAPFSDVKRIEQLEG